MTPERTEIEWTYHPTDFFEAPYRHTNSEYELLVEGGRVTATLRVPQEPVGGEFSARIKEHVQHLLLTRQLQIHRKYALHGPTIHQYVEGRRNSVLEETAAITIKTVVRADYSVLDATGNIVFDSRSERIAAHTQQLDFMAPKLAQSPELREIVKSYSRSIDDPSNELLYLYEIRDALSKYYDGEKAARTALNIPEAEWKRLGRLANLEPLEQGRHRGKHLAGRRAASNAELDEARKIVLRWITQFARSI